MSCHIKRLVTADIIVCVSYKINVTNTETTALHLRVKVSFRPMQAFGTPETFNIKLDI